MVLSADGCRRCDEMETRLNGRLLWGDSSQCTRKEPSAAKQNRSGRYEAGLQKARVSSKIGSWLSPDVPAQQQIATVTRETRTTYVLGLNIHREPSTYIHDTSCPPFRGSWGRSITPQGGEFTGRKRPTRLNRHRFFVALQFISKVSRESNKRQENTCL